MIEKEIIHCEICRHCSMKIIENEFICGHPVYKSKGKRIYRETSSIFKKLGCGSGEKK